MTVGTVTAPAPEFADALAAFKRVMNAPRVQVVEKVQALPFTVALATVLGAIK